MIAAEKKTVDVIIPVYKPDRNFEVLIKRLLKQSILPEHIYMMHTMAEGEQLEDTYAFLGEGTGNVSYQLHSLAETGNINEDVEETIHVFPVKKAEFDHAATRDAGAKKAKADYILFMTQDAMPVDNHLIENLLKGFQRKNVGICYARQLPGKEADLTEQLTRLYNYPEKSRLQTEESVKTLGIKAYFCSDVCAMYDRALYEKLGGFMYPAIFNEDMLMAYKVIDAGGSVYYTAEAKVYHSHSYTCMQQFHRNFDLGVSQRQYREIFDRISSEKEGAGFAKKTILELCRRGHVWKAVYFAWQCGFRLCGYKLGKNYEKLPHFLVMKCTMNKEYVLFGK